MVLQILRPIEAAVLEIFYLTNWHVVQHTVFEFQVPFGGESREGFEVVNEVGLIIEAAVLRDIGPINLSTFFDFGDGLLKANDFQVSLGSNANLAFEHVDEMLLRIADALTGAGQTDLIRLPDDFRQSVIDGRVQDEPGPEVAQQKIFDRNNLKI